VIFEIDILIEAVQATLMCYEIKYTLEAVIIV
jgi:hypothetical protein